jgi:hypothetical protein
VPCCGPHTCLCGSVLLTCCDKVCFGSTASAAPSLTHPVHPGPKGALGAHQAFALTKVELFDVLTSLLSDRIRSCAVSSVCDRLHQHCDTELHYSFRDCTAAAGLQRVLVFLVASKRLLHSVSVVEDESSLPVGFVQQFFKACLYAASACCAASLAGCPSGTASVLHCVSYWCCAHCICL